jgi:hypothetical protein
VEENAKVDMTELSTFIEGKKYVINAVLNDNIADSLVNALATGKIKDKACALSEYVEASQEILALGDKYDDDTFEKLRIIAHLSANGFSLKSGATTRIEKALENARKTYALLFTMAGDYTIQRNWKETYYDEMMYYLNAKNDA